MAPLTEDEIRRYVRREEWKDRWAGVQGILLTLSFLGVGLLALALLILF